MKRIVTMIMSLFLATPTALGYTATITSEQTSDTVYIHVNAHHSEDEFYNACEIEVTYDSETLSFDNGRSTLGCAAYRDDAGRLILLDFGADKPLGDSVYVLAFEAIGTGYSNIQLSRAAFSTAEKAATEDVEPIANEPDNITVWVEYPNANLHI